MDTQDTQDIYIKPFEIEFTSELRRLGLKKYEVAEHLNMTMPTLQTRILNPGKLKLDEIDGLRELKFNFETI